jgi:hypothetical protein
MNYTLWTHVQGRSFKQNDDLLLRIKEAKQYLEPSKEREIRTKQLTTHNAKCSNHSNE